MNTEPRPAPRLTDLLEAPERAMDLTLPEAAALLAKAEGLAAVARARLAAIPAGTRNGPPDDMLTVPEAAQLAGVTVTQFYRRRVFRPAIVKLGHRTVRVSENRLRRILDGASRAR